MNKALIADWLWVFVAVLFSGAVFGLGFFLNTNSYWHEFPIWQLALSPFAAFLLAMAICKGSFSCRISAGAVAFAAAMVCGLVSFLPTMKPVNLGPSAAVLKALGAVGTYAPELAEIWRFNIAELIAALAGGALVGICMRWPRAPIVDTTLLRSTPESRTAREDGDSSRESGVRETVARDAKSKDSAIKQPTVKESGIKQPTVKEPTKETPAKESPAKEAPAKPAQTEVPAAAAATTASKDAPSTKPEGEVLDEGPQLKGLLDKLEPQSKHEPPSKGGKPVGLAAAAAAKASAKGATKPDTTKSGNGAAGLAGSGVGKAAGASTAAKDTPAAKPTEEKPLEKSPEEKPIEKAAPEPQPEAAASSTKENPVASATTEPKKPTSTATRLQAQKRKSTSTFTKLQALSASGPGASARPLKPDSDDSDSLKSILERLDAGNDDYDNDILSPSESLLLSDDRGSEPEPPDLSALLPKTEKEPVKKETPEKVEAKAEEKPAAKPESKPAAKEIEKPAAREIEKPSAKPIEKPAAKPIERPANREIEKPYVKPADKEPVVSAPAASTVDSGLNLSSMLDSLDKTSGASAAPAAESASPSAVELTPPAQSRVAELLAKADASGHPVVTGTSSAEPVEAKDEGEGGGYTKEDLLAIKTPKIITTSWTGGGLAGARKGKKDNDYDDIDLPDEGLLTVEADQPSLGSILDDMTEAPAAPPAEAKSETPAEDVKSETAPEAKSETPAEELKTETAAETKTETAESETKAETPAAETKSETAPEEPKAETPAAETKSESPDAEAKSQEPSGETKSETPEAKAATESAPPAESGVAKEIASSDIDRDIDDIFKNLPTPEEQPEPTTSSANKLETIAGSFSPGESLTANEEASSNVAQDATGEMPKPTVEITASTTGETAKLETPEPAAEAKSEPEAKAEPVEAKAEPAVEAKEETAKAEPVAEKKEETAEPAKADNVFGGSIDSDIDDIFSNLAPAAALKEVKDSGYNKAYGEGEKKEEPAAETKSETSVEAKTETPPAESKTEVPVVEAKTETPPSEIKAEVPTAAETKSEKPAEKTENVFGTEVDKDIDDIFSSIAPAAAHKEVKDSGYNKAYGEGEKKDEPAAAEAKAEPAAADAKAEAKAEPVAAKPAEPVAEVKPEAREEAKPEAKSETKPEAADNVFGAKVDQDIDDLFSAITPVGAHKEVRDSGYQKAYGEDEKKEEPAAAETKPEPAKTEIPEAKAETKSEAPPAEAKEEPKAEPTAAKEEAPAAKATPESADNVFGGKVDQDIDDIFSALAPKDALKEVKDSGYNKAYGEKKEEPIAAKSETPPAEAKSEAPPAEAKKDEPEKASVESQLDAILGGDKTAVPKVNEEGKITGKPSIPEIKHMAQSGKFNQTLAHLPSMQGTVEGLLANLADMASTGDKTSSKTDLEPVKSEAPKAEETKPEPVKAEEPKVEAEPPKAEEPKPEPVKAEEPKVEAEPPKAEEPKPEPVKAEEPKVEAEPPKAEEPKPEPAKAEEPKAEEPKAEAQAEPVKEEAPKAEPAAAPEKQRDVVVEPTRVGELADAMEIAGRNKQAAKDGELKKQAAKDAEKAAKEAEKKETAATVEKQLAEFGRLSTKGAVPSAVEPVGTMKTIGKLLIEVEAVESIIKTGEATGKIGSGLTTARIINASKGAGINALLGKIDSYPNVVGSLIVGHDGLVIASTVPADMNKDTLGNLSMACLGSTNVGTRKLEIGKLQQMVMISDKNITVLTDVEVGILAVFMGSIDLEKIDGLRTAIQDTIAGG